MALALSDRDQALIRTLTRRVRFLSIKQAARTYWGRTADPEESARRRIASLEEAGVLRRFTVLAHPELELDQPEACWQPGGTPPDFGAVSYRLKARWTETVQPTVIVIATEGAGNWMGGHGGRLPRPSEATHDLHLAAVYLHMLRHAPERARFWKSEAALQAAGAGRNSRLPDAMISGRQEKTVIEFGGAYSKRKLMEFHRHCEDRQLPYEVW